MNSFDLALKVFLFLAPIFYWDNLPLAQVQIQFFQLGVIFLFLVALSQRKQRDLRDRTLFPLGFICFLNTFISPTPYGKIALVNIVFLLLFYYLVVCYTKNIRCVLKTLIFLSIINTILAVSQRFGFDFVFSNSSECCAFLGTSAFHGDFQAIVLPLAFYLHPLLAVFPVAGLLLSKSATGLVAAVSGIGFLLMRARKKLSIAYLSVLLTSFLAFIFYFRKILLYKLVMRFEIWKKAIELVFEKPLRGWGFGSINGFGKVLYWKQYGNADRLYNDYIEFALCVGVIGLILLSFFVCNKLKRYRRADKGRLLNTILASCVIISAICLSHSPMAPVFSGIGMSPRIAVVIITVLALMEIQLQKERGTINGTSAA